MRARLSEAPRPRPVLTPRASIALGSRGEWVLAAALLVACRDPAPTPPAEAPIEAPVEAPAPPPPPARPGPTCTYHGLCWSRPLPIGNDLHGVWVGGGIVVAVGERGTLLVRQGERWALEDAPSRDRMRDVWGTDPATVFAVGERGAIWRRGADGWQALESGVETDLWTVFGHAADAVWAAGEGGVILRWDGERWARETTNIEGPSTDRHPSVAREARVEGSRDATESAHVVTDIASDGAALFALAVDPGASDREPSTALLERTDVGWVERERFEGDYPALSVRAVVAEESTTNTEALPAELLVLGPDARRRGANGRFTMQGLPIDRPVNALFTTDEGTVFAVGYGARVARAEGTRWRRDALRDEARDLNAIHGDGDELWAVGAGGLIVRLVDDAWTVITEGDGASLKGVFGLAPDDVWAVGDHRTLHFDGTRWSAEGPAEHDLRAVFGVTGAIFAVGAEGAVHRRAGGAWALDRAGGGYELEGLWGATEQSLLVVGKTTWLERRDGAWHEQAERPSASGVWGSAADDVWVAGNAGLHHYDGATLRAIEGTSEQVLFDVWGAAADDVWAVGAEGRILHWDGSSWTPSEAPTQQNLLSVWGSDADDVWAVGHHGTIVRWDGERWRWRDSGTDAMLREVWGHGPDEVWIVGDGGVVLRYRGARP